MEESYPVGADGRISLVTAPDRFIWDDNHPENEGASINDGDYVVGFHVEDAERTVVVIPMSCIPIAKEAFRRAADIDAESDAIDTAVVMGLYGVNGDTCLQYPSVSASEERSCLICGETMTPSTSFLTFRHLFTREEPSSVALHQKCVPAVVEALEDAANRADVLLGQEL